MRSERVSKSSKVTLPVSGRIRIQTLSIICMSEVELGVAQPLWADTKPGFCDGRGAEVIPQGHTNIQAR